MFASEPVHQSMPAEDLTPRTRQQSRMSPERYRKELDAQVQAKLALKKAESTMPSAKIMADKVHETDVFDYALPMEEDSESKRRLAKSRQQSYRLDLDAQVQMRARKRRFSSHMLHLHWVATVLDPQ